MPPVRLLIPQQQTFGLGQIQAPACRRRNGLADTIKVAGIGLGHVALVNERLNHLICNLYLRHEGATATPFAESALATGGECASGVRLVNLVTGPRQAADAYHPGGVALDTGDMQGSAQGAAEIARGGHG